ncbi:MAG: DUF255 domain-containing protein [Planctomycetota bacterium]
MKTLLLALTLLTLAGCASSEKPSPAPTEVAWQPWSDAAFERAKREGKLVLLDLGAVWCHWCHVMDRETYGDPGVANYMGEHFVAIHVNQDERPDLANRYEYYGWPATILFAADGTELGKFRGFMPPKRLLAVLQAFVADPTPGPSALEREPDVAAAPATFAKELDDALHDKWAAAYDHKAQGWGTVHKYLDPDCVELAIAEGRDDMARGTLDAMLQLIDPVWGGVYQYSDGGVWTNPHFEKIMSFQAEDMRIFALAYRVYGEEKYLVAARDIERYLLTFLKSPEGAFYASQDADLVQGEHGGDYFSLGDSQRRAKGVPRVDTRVYARENGWAVVGLASLYRVTGDLSTLEAAIRAAEWTLAHRGTAEGGFRHGEFDSGGPFLADTLAMGRAFFELGQVTQDAKWLERSEAAVRFMEQNFGSRSGERAGYATAVAARSSGKPWEPTPQVDENIAFARLSLRLWGTGRLDLRDSADHALKYLAGVAGDASGVRAAGILLASRERAGEAQSIEVVGELADERTTALLRAALSAPVGYSLVRLLGRANTEYPMDNGTPTAYVCTVSACKGPFHDPVALRKAAATPRRR